MERKKRIEQIKELTTQVIYCKQDTADKAVHFVGGKGKNELHRGSYRNQKAFLNIIEQHLFKEITFAVEINTDFIGKWKKFLTPTFITKYSNTKIENTAGSQGYLTYSGHIDAIPPEPITIDKIRNIYDNLYNLARRIETSEKSNVLATLKQANAGQFEKMELWNKLDI